MAIDYIKTASVRGGYILFRIAKAQVVTWCPCSSYLPDEVTEVVMSNGIVYHVNMSLSDFDLEMEK